ncbi:MAG: hypothetical protein EOP87_08005 [Verrucomicrobiaceae bacterium]|nr:MAG: hypothetical protein EOP87_08005 [Verrucomicrobiaceae bacterium]
MSFRSTFLPAASALWLLSAMAHGAPLSVTDLKGRSIEIDIVSLAGDNVTFRRPGSPKEFTLAVTQFDDASQDLIRKQAAALPAAPPKLSVDVVIGKRRTDKADSYYMKTQEVTCTVRLTNLSNTNEVPSLKGKIVFIGQNTRTPSNFTVLSTQSFEASMKTGESVTRSTENFRTSYDSDNKGAGNVGGYQYYGYILALSDEAGNIVFNQTTTGSFRKALESKADLLKRVIDYPKGAALTDKLEPPPGSRLGL